MDFYSAMRANEKPCFLGLFYYLVFPDTFLDWRVTNLDLHPDNPLVIRQDYGDFDFAMYFY